MRRRNRGALAGGSADDAVESGRGGNGTGVEGLHHVGGVAGGEDFTEELSGHFGEAGEFRCKGGGYGFADGGTWQVILGERGGPEV